ncbi:MAG: hypothetical protein R2835_01785 [Thermomicrobiales bacterium]
MDRRPDVVMVDPRLVRLRYDPAVPVSAAFETSQCSNEQLELIALVNPSKTAPEERKTAPIGAVSADSWLLLR